MPSLDFYIQGKVTHRATGALLKQYPKQRANSLLEAFIKGMYTHMSTEYVTGVDILGASLQIRKGSATFQANHASGYNTRGLVIGTGTNPVAIDDYKLQTQATTDVDHSNNLVTYDQPDANTRRCLVVRAFSNNTGGVLAVRECALYLYLSAPTSKPFCIERSLYSVDVPNGQVLTLTYALTATL